MNNITSSPISHMGYDFIPREYLPEGKDEYHIRNIQNSSDTKYYPLTQQQKDILISLHNTSDDWTQVLVAEDFIPQQVKNCSFYGLVRIGNMQPLYKEFHDFKMPIGIYNSKIISCDLGDNVCIDNVNYLSHFIIGDNVMIANVRELATTNTSKFGNGIIKEGEDQKLRTKIEVCNENGGRSILPFNGMLTGDAYMWSKYREDEKLMNKFTDFTDKQLDLKRGYYGKIGERSVIKNCNIIKDVWIGTDAYLKGANKIKNVTINSDLNRKSQIGEGCEIVNGIVGFGCRIFYGVKAVRFVMSSHSQLKYGARLINSFLGNNSTISCCEVLNSLIYPSHEQHHNNSFLCASLVMGQSNIAAGVTIGSNHNSRAADGEIIAGRGFWPGLCVSLKHNSKFASYILIAKGDYPVEMNIPLPFSLLSINAENDVTTVMPAYWFMYNMYALKRNSWKAAQRDRRTERIQLLEQHFLAPDTVNEMFVAIEILESLDIAPDGSAFVNDWENGKRTTQIIKVKEGISEYKKMIFYYAAINMLDFFTDNDTADFTLLKSKLLTQTSRSTFENIGGQLINNISIARLKKNIKSGNVDTWEAVHNFYKEEGNVYKADKLQHAYTSYLELTGKTHQSFTKQDLDELFNEMIITKTWMCKSIYKTREKDHTSKFRKMVYDNEQQMDAVLGKLDDNEFITLQFRELEFMKQKVKVLSTVRQPQTS